MMLFKRFKYGGSIILIILILFSLFFFTFTNRSAEAQDRKSDYRGVYSHNDWEPNPTIAKQDFISGAEDAFGWKSLNPSRGNYNFGKLDRWIEKVKNNEGKAVLSVMPRCGANTDKFELCAPEWLTTSQFSNVKIHYNGKDIYLLDYNNPTMQNEMKKFVYALAHRYAHNKNIAAVKIAVGYESESRPMSASVVVASRDIEKAAYIQAWGEGDANKAAQAWMGYQKKLFSWYHDAFYVQEKATDLPISVVYLGVLNSHAEVQERVKIAKSYGFGLHHTGLESNFSWSASINHVCTSDLPEPEAYRGHWEAVERLHNVLPMSFEFSHPIPKCGFNITRQEHIWWSVLNALDKGGWVIEVFKADYDGRSQIYGALRFFDKYARKTPSTTRDAWIALRTYIDYPNPYSKDCGFPKTYCPDKGNYDFYITQNTNISSGSTIANFPSKQGYAEKKVRSKDDVDWHGPWSRQTDAVHNKPYLFFNINDQFINSHTKNTYTFVVSYWDGDSGDKGTKWDLVYKDKNGNTVQKDVVLSGSEKWVEKTFHLDDAVFSNSLDGGSDFALFSPDSTDDYFDFVKVSADGSSSSTCNKSKDINKDSKVNFQDVFSIIKKYLTHNIATDLDCDGSTNWDDLIFFIKNSTQSDENNNNDNDNGISNYSIRMNLVWKKENEVPKKQTHPAISYDSENNNVFLVWEDNRNDPKNEIDKYGSGNNSDIYGRLYDTNGKLVSNEILIAGGGEYDHTGRYNNEQWPDVKFNNKTGLFHIVWMNIPKQAAVGDFKRTTCYDVAYRVFNPVDKKLGVVVTDVSGYVPPDDLIDPWGYKYDWSCQQEPRVNISGKNISVWWQDHRERYELDPDTSKQLSKDIYGQVIKNNNITKNGGWLISANNRSRRLPMHQEKVAVATDVSDGGLVIWQDERNSVSKDPQYIGERQIYGRFIKFSNNDIKLEKEFLISKNLPSFSSIPRISYIKPLDSYLITWSQQDTKDSQMYKIYYSVVDKNKSLVDSPKLLPGSVSDINPMAQPVCANTTCVVVYRQQKQGQYYIYIHNFNLSELKFSNQTFQLTKGKSYKSYFNTTMGEERADESDLYVAYVESNWINLAKIILRKE